MAILCGAAKNSLRGTTVLQKIYEHIDEKCSCYTTVDSQRLHRKKCMCITERICHVMTNYQILKDESISIKCLTVVL